MSQNVISQSEAFHLLNNDESTNPIAENAPSGTLYKHGKKIFEIHSLDKLNIEEPLYSSRYKIILLTQGTSDFVSNDQTISMHANELLFLTSHFLAKPYVDEFAQGWMITFHSEFYCLQKHQQEVGCNGILFNDTYRVTTVRVTPEAKNIFLELISNLLGESAKESPVKKDAMIAYLKLFLIHASRLKLQQQPLPTLRTGENDLPTNVIAFQQLLEEHFPQEHSLRFYCRQLNLSTSSLNRLTRKYFSRSATRFVHDRIILEAKRELYLSQKAIKEISFALGFDDEFYFSRVFKKYTGLSPSQFRIEHAR